MEKSNEVNGGFTGKSNEEDKEEVVLEKAPFVAVCSCFKCHITPFRDSDGRVRFRARGPVTEALTAIQNNIPIPIGDFLSKLDTVRSLIFSLKGNGLKVEAQTEKCGDKKNGKSAG